MKVIPGDVVRIPSSGTEGTVETAHMGRFTVRPRHGRARIARDVVLVSSYELELARRCADRGLMALRAGDDDSARYHGSHGRRHLDKAIRRGVDHRTELALTEQRIADLTKEG